MARRSLDKLLALYSEPLRDLALRARDYILKWLPGVQETLDESAPVIGYGYGPGYSALVCTLIVSKSGLKVGLNGGAHLPDPDGLLEGAGKVHKYIRIEKIADLRRPGLRRLVRDADEARIERQTAHAPSNNRMNLTSGNAGRAKPTAAHSRGRRASS